MVVENVGMDRENLEFESDWGQSRYINTQAIGDNRSTFAHLNFTEVNALGSEGVDRL